MLHINTRPPCWIYNNTRFIICCAKKWLAEYIKVSVACSFSFNVADFYSDSNSFLLILSDIKYWLSREWSRSKIWLPSVGNGGVKLLFSWQARNITARYWWQRNYRIQEAWKILWILFKGAHLNPYSKMFFCIFQWPPIRGYCKCRRLFVNCLPLSETSKRCLIRHIPLFIVIFTELVPALTLRI